jgi:predicted DNA binding CopG/RHH family protein
MKYLDKEEKEIIESYEKGEWQSVPNKDILLRKYAKYAANTLKKDKRVNIRISSRDFLEIKRKATKEGLPYQTLIASLIHKYTSGLLREN